jgi:hypothetical protein
MPRATAVRQRGSTSGGSGGKITGEIDSRWAGMARSRGVTLAQDSRLLIYEYYVYVHISFSDDQRRARLHADGRADRQVYR